MSESIQRDEPVQVEIALRAVKELREINARLRLVLILLVIPYVLAAAGLLLALLAGGTIDIRVD